MIFPLNTENVCKYSGHKFLPCVGRVCRLSNEIPSSRVNRQSDGHILWLITPHRSWLNYNETICQFTLCFIIRHTFLIQYNLLLIFQNPYVGVSFVNFRMHLMQLRYNYYVISNGCTCFANNIFPPLINVWFVGDPFEGVEPFSTILYCHVIVCLFA